MPTSFDFDLAAALFDSVAELETILAPAAAALGRDTVSGGQLGLLIDATLDATSHTLASTAATLQADARLCRQRADDCRAYGAAVAAY
ncbi:MAG: hypothetical protein R2706_10455 [Acidimicrobiales bacterium]